MNTPDLPHAPVHELLASLVGMLSCGDLDTHEIGRIAALCQHARDDAEAVLHREYGPEAARLAGQPSPAITAFIIFVELEDYFAVADTVDELYEQIVAAFERPLLPPYPYDDNDFQTVDDFYQWTEAQLRMHHPRYRLLAFGQSYTHDFQVILVLREQVDDILALCGQLGLYAELCA
ncbi:hypothetical protein ERD78_15495 [Allopusillimonas soli]|uniref:Uncharacterized protein n=1 Tax=Allopusillimonas soli TaxID=659016 RepID=A0A853FHX3_9BURK|nr:hypothetical protein [Allopusillimonas soli]NYT38380.1 hypothetical protein [Allopusillimonas soli]TEA72055.1 hypothetical protein ERD78_15495 [Allopusillimonas soli]